MNVDTKYINITNVQMIDFDFGNTLPYKSTNCMCI